MVKRFDVSVPKKYTKDGEERTMWNRVGTIVKFEATGDKPESYMLELSMFPDTKFGVFEAKPKELGNIPNTNVPYPTGAETGADVVNPDNIPF
jgi:hypothetical protein